MGIFFIVVFTFLISKILFTKREVGGYISAYFYYNNLT